MSDQNKVFDRTHKNVKQGIGPMSVISTTYHNVTNNYRHATNDYHNVSNNYHVTNNYHNVTNYPHATTTVWSSKHVFDAYLSSSKSASAIYVPKQQHLLCSLTTTTSHIRGDDKTSIQW
ncbi:uncharacterized protein LOC121377789 [Gigantopelta aegis]|uniref:uncharacterized protein LOC121377789 n=1 Tax=Gigantopelta aegis TaxID=1735272 RepID=UPI001B88904B|nr:uncharacterized protein LOC121377789 [Gigantopelta aegis]XP_041361815.1 uncharacterized protein LOC121377789 [Gigantopelta aegis]